MQGSACSRCGGQLAALSGPLLIDAPGMPPGAKRVPEPTPRGRRERYIGCGSCHNPVPVNHARQIAEDAAWDELEEREARQRVAALKQLPPPTPTYRELNPVADAVDQVEVLTKDVVALKKMVGELGQTIHGLRNEIQGLKNKKA